MDPAASPAPDLSEHVDRALLDAAGNVATDVLCHACHYNLRTLPAMGVCPECGAPVGDSLRRPDLEFASREWVRQLGEGLGLVATVYLLVAIAAGLVLLTVLAETPAPLVLAVLLVVGLVLPLGTVGLVLATRRERTPAPGAGDSRLRGAARVTALAAVGLGVTGVARVIADLSANFALPILGGLLLGSSVVLALCVVPALLWGYVHVLMRRAGRPELARRAGLLAPVHVVASLAILVAPLFDTELLGPVALGGVCVLATAETLHLSPVSIALDKIARPHEELEAAGGGTSVNPD